MAGTRRALDAIVSLFVVLSLFAPLTLFFVAAWQRARFPFELEWMEGGVIDHIRVILEGRSLYRAPSFAFTPFIYAPGYYYVCALASKILGVGFLAPRLVSLLSITCAFVLLAHWVARETHDRLAGFAAAGLFAATYALSGFWFDVARVDSLFLALLLGGYTAARFGRGMRWSVAAGSLLTAACLTKQVGLPLAAPALLYAWSRSRRHGLALTATFLVLGGLVFGLLEVTSGGWFSFYVFRVPADHTIFWDRLKTELLDQYWTPVTGMTLASLAVLAGAIPAGGFGVWAFRASWIAVALATSLTALLHTGGFSNVLMPAHAALATGAGFALAALRRGGNAASSSAPGGALWFGRRVLAAAALTVQVALLWHGPLAPIVPSKADRLAGQEMLAAVRQSPGPVWMVSSGYYPLLAKNAPITSHSMALADIFKSRREGVKARLRSQIVWDIRQKRFGTIVLDRAAGFLPADIVDEIHRSYRMKVRLFSPSDPRFWPRVGAEVRPDELWVPVTD